MREEKYSEIIHDALNFLDDEMIEEVDKLRGGVAVGSVSGEHADTANNIPKHPRAWRKWAAIAASICLLVMAGNAWEMLQENQFNTGNLSGGNQADDGVIEEDMADVNQSGSTSMSPESEDNKYGEQDNVEANVGDQDNYEESQLSDKKPDVEIVNLQNYETVYYSEVKNETPSDDNMVKLSKEECEILDKFLDSMQRGKIIVVDEASQSEMKIKADGQLIFELEDGTRFHLILIADGMVCSDETSNVWIQMDKRVYRTLIEILKEDS